MNKEFEKANEIRRQYRQGKLTFDQAMEALAEYETYFNEKAIKLAKKYKVAPKLFRRKRFLMTIVIEKYEE